MKICVRCNGKNSADYKYCKFCGAELPCVDRKPLRYSENECSPSPEHSFSPDSSEISVEEMKTYVGKNCEQIVPRFVWLSKGQRRQCWCLPVFLFGLFFGTVGTAVWFLYRKINKTAVFLLGLALLLQAIEMVVNFESTIEFYRALYSVTLNYIEGSSGDTSAMNGFAQYVTQLQNWYTDNTNGIVQIVCYYAGQVVVPIIYGFIGFNIYKKHAESDIIYEKSIAKTPAAYVEGLKRSGGVSVGRVFLGLGIYMIISTAMLIIPMVIAMIGA